MPAGRPNQTYSLQKLWGKQEEILRYFAIGTKPRHIAEALGVTVQTVHNICNSSLGQAKIRQLQGHRDVEFMQVQHRIAELAPVALEVAEETMLAATTPTKLKYKIAHDVLAMAGHGPVQKAVVRQTARLSDEDRKAIDAIAKTFINGEPEDVSYKEI